MSSELVPVPPRLPTPPRALVQYGDITLTEHELVTPSGTRPLAGTQLFVQDMSRTDRYTPGWAIALGVVLLVLFFWTIIGLGAIAFFFVKADRRSGFVQFTATNGSFTHQSFEPALPDGQAQLFEAQARLNYGRGLIARVA